MYRSRRYWCRLRLLHHITLTHCRVVVPVQQLVLAVALAVVWVTENCVECVVEAVTFGVQLISGHAGQSVEIRLIECEQWRCQLTHKVILLTRLAQQTNSLVRYC